MTQNWVQIYCVFAAHPLDLTPTWLESNCSTFRRVDMIWKETHLYWLYFRLLRPDCTNLKDSIEHSDLHYLEEAQCWNLALPWSGSLNKWSNLRRNDLVSDMINDPVFTLEEIQCSLVKGETTPWSFTDNAVLNLKAFSVATQIIQNTTLEKQYDLGWWNKHGSVNWKVISKLDCQPMLSNTEIERICTKEW